MGKFTRHLTDLLSGRFLAKNFARRQYKLAGLIVVLVIGYIALGYRGQNKQHQLTELKKELMDARFTQMTIRTQEVSMTRSSAVVAELKERGSVLKECTEPVIVIK